jgi:hypothetical protein
MKPLLFILVFANFLYANVDSFATQLKINLPGRHFHKNMLYGIPNKYSSNHQDFVFQKNQQLAKPSSLKAQPFIATAFGLASAFCFGAVAAGAAENANYNSSLDGWVAFVYGGFSGYLFGNALGCWHYGKLRKVQGSFEGTLMGSLIGGFVGIGLTVATQNAAPVILGPPIGATITFRLTMD